VLSLFRVHGPDDPLQNDNSQPSFKKKKDNSRQLAGGKCNSTMRGFNFQVFGTSFSGYSLV
jgi:hypothetical protein